MMYKTHHPLYRVWKDMRSRCNSPSSTCYQKYGAMGISVCKQWDDFWVFIEDMGEKPTDKHEIERIDSKGDYCPENCRWATRAEQMRNTNRTHMITFNGETMCLTDWAKRIGISPLTLSSRINTAKMPIEKALTMGHQKAPIITFNGESGTPRYWEKKTGLKGNTITRRLDSGWTVEDALTLKNKRGSRQKDRTPIE